MRQLIAIQLTCEASILVTSAFLLWLVAVFECSVETCVDSSIAVPGQLIFRSFSDQLLLAFQSCAMSNVLELGTVAGYTGQVSPHLTVTPVEVLVL